MTYLADAVPFEARLGSANFMVPKYANQAQC